MRAQYRAIIVDDEPLARRRLRQLLAAAPDFDVIAECEDARLAAELAERLRPDVVFLDIRMPHADGFSVQAALRERVPHIVFVTAHSEHAARAFDVAASDYLVKPVTQARFNDALARVRRTALQDAPARVLLGGRLGGTAVALEDIRWLEARGAYVRVHTAGHQHVVRESLGQLLTRLGARDFVRIHRSAGISLSHLRALKRLKTGLTVVLDDGTRLPISRRRAREILALLRGRSEQHTTDTDAAD